jgi:hypothetical protein
MEVNLNSITPSWYQDEINVSNHLSQVKARSIASFKRRLAIFVWRFFICMPASINQTNFHFHTLDKQVFPSLELIGWYTVAPQPTTHHIAMFPQFVTYTQNPLFLILQPGLQGVQAGGVGKTEQQQQLPISVYEPTLGLGTNRTMLIKVEYKVETGEAERIAVDWTSKGGEGGGSRTY